jgi:hypothetical protein
MFFGIYRWVSIGNYNPIFLHELALVFQKKHQCKVIAYLREPFLAVDGPSAIFSSINGWIPLLTLGVCAECVSFLASQ